MTEYDFAPILIFVYKRLDTLQLSVNALQRNFLAKESEVFIFSDSAKGLKDQAGVSAVRNYLRTIDGFKQVHIIESATNKGLANSIIDGVTQVIRDYKKVIVLEDDLITSTNFLLYMNQCLDYYRRNTKVFSVSGFSFIIKGLSDQDIYFTQRASSWSWATWDDRWSEIDWDVKDYSSFRKSLRQRWAFNRMGSDMAGMLDKQMRGKMDSWAIRWCYHQFKKQSYTVFPAYSKVQNIGFVAEATHTHDVPDRYATKLDDTSNMIFNFTDHIQLEPAIIKQFTSHYSISSRIKYKVINTFYNTLKRQYLLR
jgi:hypothetical protein